MFANVAARFAADMLVGTKAPSLGDPGRLCAFLGTRLIGNDPVLLALALFPPRCGDVAPELRGLALLGRADCSALRGVSLDAVGGREAGRTGCCVAAARDGSRGATQTPLLSKASVPKLLGTWTRSPTDGSSRPAWVIGPLKLAAVNRTSRS